MAITVEDGTNVADANSYLSLADITSYHAMLGQTQWAAQTDDALKEAAVIRATRRLDSVYAWEGERSHDRDQPLQWPRRHVKDEEYNVIESDEIPREIKDALAELALIELISPSVTTLEESQTITNSTQVRSERRRLGDLETETEYFSTGNQRSNLDYNDNFSAMERIDLIIGAFGSRIGRVTSPTSGRTVRV